MEYINTGKVPNDQTGDTLRAAAEKINHNFSEVFDKLRMKEPFKVIVWEDLADTKKAMDDVNYNFKKVEEHLSS